MSIVNSWAKDVYNIITNTVNPLYLQQLNKANARMLTDSEVQDLEEIKFNALCSIQPLTKVNENTVLAALAENMVASKTISEVYINLVERFKEKVRPEPSIEDYRNLRICAYSMVAFRNIKESQ
jgi:hypothetical protein